MFFGILTLIVGLAISGVAAWYSIVGLMAIFAAAKMAALRGWLVSKLDVKGAFLNAPLPEGELILVQPPAQWVK